MKKLLVSGAGLLALAVTPASHADWKSMSGQNCGDAYGGKYCEIVRELRTGSTFNDYVTTPTAKALTVYLNGSGLLICAVYSYNGTDSPAFPLDQVNKSRTDAGEISFSASELGAALTKANGGHYAVLCYPGVGGQDLFVRSYQWNEGTGT